MLRDHDDEYFLETQTENLNFSKGFETPPKKNKRKNKKRFSDKQIGSLEHIFESETRLQPNKKVELARELGLQPRQVAIWFQNKRARFKSKELERDYNLLRESYSDLTSKYEELKKENHELITQVEKMNEMLKKPKEERQYEEKASTVSMEERREFGGLPDDHDCVKTNYFGLEEGGDRVVEASFLMEPGGDSSSLTSSENWGTLDSEALFDQSSSSYQWWDFWS